MSQQIMNQQKEETICVSVFKSSTESLGRSLTEKWIELIQNLEKSKYISSKK